MLSKVMKLGIGSLLLALIAVGAVSLHAAPSRWYVCPFVGCTALPGGGQRVYCRVGRTGPVQIKYLNQCCCNQPNGWENLYSPLNP
jgi:hypothetical protein